MNNLKQLKLENAARLAELNPAGTLARIGLGENDIVCDVGAGSGIFTVAAAQITKNTVYALEIDENMLEVIGAKAEDLGLPNIELVKVEDNTVKIADHAADLVLMVTVLHEIEHYEVFLAEIKRILKNGGRIMVIEFHEGETTMGPPPAHRMGREDVRKAVGALGLSAAEDFDLGENMYCMVFK